MRGRFAVKRRAECGDAALVELDEGAANSLAGCSCWGKPECLAGSEGC